jgi:hypothetical protein
LLDITDDNTEKIANHSNGKVYSSPIASLSGDPSVDHASTSFHIIELSSRLKDILSKLQKMDTGSSGRKLINKLHWPFKEGEIRKDIDSVHRATELLMDAVSIDTLSLAAATYKEVGAMRDSQSHIADAAIYQWLSPLDFSSKQSDISRKTHLGTGKWVIDSSQFSAWFSSKENFTSTLWCPGGPGVGKTFIS